MKEARKSYKIVRSFTMDMLFDAVNETMLDGYEPFGPISGGDITGFWQAVILPVALRRSTTAKARKSKPTPRRRSTK